MKNKKLITLIIIIAVLLFIGLFFVYYYHESSLLDSNDKKWISENGKKIIDIEVFNDVAVFGTDGNGVVFDFLSYVTDETDLQFNKKPYSKEIGPTSNSYKIEMIDSSNLDSNKLLMYEDNYVIIYHLMLITRMKPILASYY